MSQSPLIQLKLTVNQPNDLYEQEADRVADAVMRTAEPGVQRQVEPEEGEWEETLQTKPLAAQITPLIQRQIEPEEEEEPIQAKQAGGQTPQVRPVMQKSDSLLEMWWASSIPLPAQLLRAALGA